jgi:hypothetical protein
VNNLIALWNGDIQDEYAEGAVIGTVAVSLFTLGRAASREEAELQARAMWDARNRTRFATAA